MCSSHQFIDNKVIALLINSMLANQEYYFTLMCVDLCYNSLPLSVSIVSYNLFSVRSQSIYVSESLISIGQGLFAVLCNDDLYFRISQSF